MLIALLATWTLWFAHPEEAVSPHLYPEYYDTLDEAGIAAVHHIYDHSQFYEYYGVILQTTNGKYRVAVPETDYVGDAVRITQPRNDFAGYTIVADFHSHPCMPYSHYVHVFSDGDVTSNSTSTLVGYMGDFCTGEVRRFVPGKTPEDKCWPVDLLERKIDPDAHCGSHGEIVGKIQLTRKPVIVENPGPQALKRGKLN